jgi:hypothetical protein
MIRTFGISMRTMSYYVDKTGEGGEIVIEYSYKV